jgi:integrase
MAVGRWLAREHVMKTLITDRSLKAIKPSGKRQIVWDTAVPNFCAIATAKGKIHFAVIRRLPGSRAPLTRRLGQYPVMALVEAREAARIALRDLAEGIDPKDKRAAERRAESLRRANSFATVAEDFITRHVKKLRTGHNIEATIRRELVSRWAERPITDISRRDIVEFVEEITNSGRPQAAHKAFAHCSKLFVWALARHIVEASPCDGIKVSELAGKKEPRQRVLNDPEIRALWLATEGLGYPAAPFVRLLLLTGQRLREVAEMTWAEVDLESALWTLPPERMKGDAAHEVPLAPAAVELLKSLPRWTGPFVFSTTGGERPISGFSKMKLRIDSALGDNAAPWRFHDLRRTMRTGLGALPVPNNVAELCIAHAQPGLHKVYDRHGYRDEKRRAFELWAARAAEIVERA